ncbi:anti-phage ZorAB system protein ZorA [Acidovorax sp. SUPP3334]|uniref:anti-phage ZorAB system protein ZorA n=1 Tax=Acidovorax sp. SUPP3334 TaxID=2920881 RepID=UPI0023DE589E|nr:anti-phage ZorAB system protein ZorA [Acidovorax sp. SUPP3334]GKT26046.1 anti-phage defense ZorAB system protein ZorA [Acidovorax sp. SUPP3334]
MNYQSILATTPTTVLATGAVLAILVLIFCVVFLAPGVLHWFRLMSIQRQINNFDSKNFASEFKKVFAKDKRLSHLWKEYQDSLHIQREERDGQLTIVATRATVPSELYFNSQFVVDSRLRTEFFKHLPGLFTGIGIIGTFSGLIEGLRVFQVSENAATVRASLESLMHSVGEAFLVSAAAIAAAMVVTFVEKLLLASLYRRTEEVAHAIDAHFDSGAGEEYLSRLVRASEDSASQSKILKDALVKELGELLRELTTAQIASAKESQLYLAERLTQTSKEQVEATRQDNQALGVTIAESIQQSLQGPLQDIANTVKSASGDQSGTAARMLQDVMASFSQRLNDLFGGQISGLSDLNQQTAKSIQEAVGTLQTLVSNIEESSRRSTDTMAERMAQAIEKMEARQEAMNAQSTAFVEQIRQLVASSQSETNTKLQSTLETIGTQVAGMLATLSESQASVFEGNRSREQSMTDRAKSAVSSMSESVEAAIKEMSAASTQMAQNVAVLTQTTSSSVDKMNAGAEQLGTASRNFAAAGERVSGVMGQAANVTAKLSETSGALTTGASALQELLRDYKTQRDAVGQLVSELRATVELARKEASLTGDVLARIESSATRLGTAQKQADEYLAGVSRVLGEAHTTFATEVKRTLEKANTEFHNKLSGAVGLLSSGVQELEVTLAAMGNMKPARV